MGYAKDGVVYRVVGQPGVTKGGQIAVFTEASRCRPQAYAHCHRAHTKPAPFTTKGNNKVRMIALKLLLLCGPGQIFHKLPHMIWDNFFAGNVIMDYLGSLGFGCTMTNSCDQFPDGVAKCYLHHEKGVVSERSKGKNKGKAWIPISICRNV